MSKPKSKAGDPAPVPPAPPAPSAVPTFLQSLLASLLARGQAFYSVVLAPFGLRTILLGGLAVLLLAHDAIAAKSFLMPFGLVCAVLAFTHWLRKVIAPDVDRQALAASAEATALGAALVYVAEKVGDIAVMFFILFAAVR